MTDDQFAFLANRLDIFVVFLIVLIVLKFYSLLKGRK